MARRRSQTQRETASKPRTQISAQRRAAMTSTRSEYKAGDDGELVSWRRRKRRRAITETKERREVWFEKS